MATDRATWSAGIREARIEMQQFLGAEDLPTQVSGVESPAAERPQLASMAAWAGEGGTEPRRAPTALA